MPRWRVRVCEDRWSQSTQRYLHADLALKQRTLDRTTPPNTRPSRYRPPDALLTFLEEL
jgi:integrase/recombinase XerD